MAAQWQKAVVYLSPAAASCWWQIGFFVAVHCGCFGHCGTAMVQITPQAHPKEEDEVQGQCNMTQPKTKATRISLFFFKMFWVLTPYNSIGLLFNKGWVLQPDRKNKKSKLSDATQNTTFQFSNHSHCSQPPVPPPLPCAATTCSLPYYILATNRAPNLSEIFYQPQDQALYFLLHEKVGQMQS